MSEYTKAEKILRKAIELDPNYAKAFNNLGNIFSKSKRRYKEAIVAYNKAIKINPNYYEAYNNLGNILAKIGEIRSAELALQKAKKINPNFDEITQNLIIFYRSFNKLKKAYSLLNKHVKNNPSAEAKFLEIKSDLLSEFGNFKEALHILKKIHIDEPGNYNVISKILSLSFIYNEKEALDLHRKYCEVIESK